MTAYLRCDVHADESEGDLSSLNPCNFTWIFVTVESIHRQFAIVTDMKAGERSLKCTRTPPKEIFSALAG